MEEIRKIQAANPSEWEKVTAFLRERDLPVRREYADACFGAFIGGRLVGTVILSGSVVRNTAVDPEMRHKGIVEKLFTAVIEEARERGIFYLQLFTKSQNAEAFSGAGFRLVENVPPYACLLEFGSCSPQKWIRRICAGGVNPNARSSAVIVNANPFTLGHKALIELAARDAEQCIVFVVEENQSVFPFDVRLALVRAGTADLPNVRVVPSGPYIISAGTFPSYFLKKNERLPAQTHLDGTIFAHLLAPGFGITKRFVGTEPTDPVTRAYNEALKDVFKKYALELVEVPRIEDGVGAISASRVRAAWTAEWTRLRSGCPHRPSPISSLLKGPHCVKRSAGRRHEHGDALLFARRPSDGAPCRLSRREGSARRAPEGLFAASRRRDGGSACAQYSRPNQGFRAAAAAAGKRHV